MNRVLWVVLSIVHGDPDGVQIRSAVVLAEHAEAAAALDSNSVWVMTFTEFASRAIDIDLLRRKLGREA